MVCLARGLQRLRATSNHKQTKELIMTRKAQRRTRGAVASLVLSFLLSTAGCGGVEGVDDEIASSSSKIVNGWSRDPKSFPVGLSDGSCSVSMIGSDVGFTSRDCAARSKTVTLDVMSSSVRVQRDMVVGTAGSTRHIEGPIVAVQLRRSISKHPGLQIDKTPLRSGEVVDCFGYNGGQLRSGSFRVGDIVKGIYYLHGLPSRSGLPHEVSSQDVGGYCQRDGKFAIAGILVQETKQGVATLAPANHLMAGREDMLYAASAARQGVAVRILDEARRQYLTARLHTPGLLTSGRYSDDRQQAFYLDEVTNPPGGGFDWYRLVDVATGQCATVTGGTPAVIQSPCDAKLKSQMFQAEYKYVNGKGIYRFHGSGGVIDRIGGSVPVSITKASQASTQWWNMWLTQM
jgi:hypothetical protein